MTVRPRIVPLPTEESQPYWDGLREHVIRLQRCSTCGTLRHPPRPLCPACASFAFTWVASTGRGAVFSFTEVTHAAHPAVEGDLPYVIGLVRLDEGVVLVTRLVGALAREPRVGAPVRAVFERVTESVTLAYFELDR